MRGRWITPGLIDTNVHFSQSGWVDTRPDILDVRSQFAFEEAVAALQEFPDVRMRAWLQCGVTTVLDRGGFPWTWDLRPSSATLRPFVAAVGPVMATRSTLVSLAGSQQTLIVQSRDDVRVALRYLGSRRADAIAFHWDSDGADTSSLAQQTAVLRAVADEAQHRHLPLIVQSASLAGAKAAVDVGARSIHGVSDAPLDAEFLQRALAANVLYGVSIAAVANQERFAQAVLEKRMPRIDDPFAVIDTATAALLAHTPELALSGKAILALRHSSAQLPVQLQHLRGNLQIAGDAGLKIVLGTDAGSPFTLHGAAIFAEMEAMQSAGLSPVQILEAATSNAALLLQRFADRGELRAGAIADLVILDADPTTDIAHMRQQAAVMRAGELRWNK